MLALFALPWWSTILLARAGVGPFSVRFRRSFFEILSAKIPSLTIFCGPGR